MRRSNYAAERSWILERAGDADGLGALVVDGGPRRGRVRKSCKSFFDALRRRRRRRRGGGNERTPPPPPLKRSISIESDDDDDALVSELDRAEKEWASSRGRDVTAESRSAVRLVLRRRYCTPAKLSKALRDGTDFDNLTDRDVRRLFEKLCKEGYLRETLQTNEMGYATRYLTAGPRSEALLSDGSLVVRASLSEERKRKRRKKRRKLVKGQRRLAFGKNGGLRCA